MADILASPLAFERCEGGICGERKPDAKEEYVSCPPSDNCTKGGCYCQLFKRKKGSPDTVPWELPRMDHDKQIKYKPTEFDYRCLCVKPILEYSVKIDGVEHTMRFVQCGLGLCSLDTKFQQPPWGGDLIKTFQCSGDCKDHGKCTLFRLQIRGDGFDPKEAKWEYKAKADKQIEYDDKYIYHCFCLK